MSVQREYWYEYDSQMLTGIRVVNKQYSGLRVRARVMLQKNRDEYITLKVSIYCNLVKYNIYSYNI